MPIERKHIALKECRPCIVLKQDTFAGILSATGVNNVQIPVSTPIAYFQALQKELDDKLHQRGVKGSYHVSIKVNPKDNRSFLSATFRYGRRLLTFTNVASLPHLRTKEQTTFCIQQTQVTATRVIKLSSGAQKWITEHEAAWKKAGYKGHFNEIERSNGTIWTGNFDHAKEDKHVRVTSKRTSKRNITITLVQTVTSTENIRTKDKPQNWVHSMHKKMIENNFKGEIKTHVNSYDKLIIDGRYTKTIKVDNGTNAYVVLFFNQMEKMSSAPIEDTSSWRPTKKVGHSYAQVRSIAQDDEYTPEFRGKKINWERIDIDKLYQEYLQMPANEVEQAQKRLEAMNERAASKGQKAALKWLRHIRNSRPQWLQAPNAMSLALYCIKYIEREVMTPSEASVFCKNNAYKK